MNDMHSTPHLTGTYELDPAHSTVAFAIGHMSLSTFRASFGDVEARLVADAGRLELEGRTRADSISIAEPSELREHVLDGDDFLHADEHPELSFRSTAVDLRETGGVTVTGVLALRGIGREVTLEGRLNGPIADPFGGERVALELRATVDRRAWEMTWQNAMPDGADAVGWDVELSADLELVKAA
ncbi:MAG TPA: YceI family protein [Gaiella sp.]|jgi:polyisoprenoid-binding protein YceI|nr:YceI family protein [Gaiella sp.]